MRSILIAISILVLMVRGDVADAASRVALVVGNASYANAPRLKNPLNDAQDMAAALKTLGFDVRVLTDSGYDEMRRALITFGQDARAADMAVIFFAGHGMEMSGENWLIPVDANLASEVDAANEAIALKSLMRAVSSTTTLGLVILDACRNNPFIPKMRVEKASRSVDRGFARVEPSNNVLVAYAARDGTTANDGAARNSPFTGSLLKNIAVPGLEVRFLFAGVRDDVMASTGNQQEPYIYGSLSRKPIYFQDSKVVDTNSEDGRLVGATERIEREKATQPASFESLAKAPADRNPGEESRTSDFIFPLSSSRLLTQDEIARRSPADLRIARNEIFARRGRFFESPDLKQRFGSYAWYRPVTWNPVLSPVETANVAMLNASTSPVATAPPAAAAGRSEFIFPYSDRRELDSRDISSLSKADLRIARNEIYARRGRTFDSPDLRSYFSRLSWYRPTGWNGTLNSIEMYNVRLIEQQEARR